MGRHSKEADRTFTKKGVSSNGTRFSQLRILDGPTASRKELENRPKSRGECRDGPRPCPWVGCRYHLFLEVKPSGGIRLNVGDMPSFEGMEYTCALDAADDNPDGMTLEGLGQIFGITRERVRQIERKALRILREAAPMAKLSAPEDETRNPNASKRKIFRG